MKKNIVIWNHFGNGGTRYALQRFRDEGHGAIFGDECSPKEIERAAYVISEFMEGKDKVMLMLSRDKLVTDLVALLAKTKKVKVSALPEIPSLKYDSEWYGGSTRALNLDEQFEEVISAMAHLQPYEMAEREDT